MLRPTFLGFETAKRALSASQRGLDTVGHNIANVNTLGYTRQRVDQVSLNSGGYKSKFQVYGAQFTGQGSNVIGISQIRDQFLDRRYRTEASNAGELSAVSDGLAHINSIFDEIVKTGSHAKLTDFINAIGKLAETADSKELATVLRSKAEQFCNVLNKNYMDLESTTTQIQNELNYTCEEVNTILSQIAALNNKIKEDNLYGNPSLELQDKRNLLIDQLSELVDIEIKNTPVQVSTGITISQLSIEIRGSGDASKGIDPIVLVNGGDYNGLKMYANGDGTVAISLIDGLSGFDIVNPVTGTSDITGKLYTGAIKGHLDILNGKGTYAGAGEKDFRGLPYYKQLLDDYAREFANVMNEVNKVQVWDAQNNVFTSISRPLFTTDKGDSDVTNITAKNITVSPQWKENADYITKASKNNALLTDTNGNLIYKDADNNMITTDILLSSVAGIDSNGFLIDAAGNILEYSATGVQLNLNNLKRAMTEDTPPISKGDPVPEGEGYDYLPGSAANDNLNALKLALTDPHKFGQTFPGSKAYTGNFQEFLVSFQGEMALDKEINDALLDASLSVLGGLADSRDAVSAVSIDEEGINMMTFQNYYNAAARYMTVLDEALGTIIQGMGVVGR